MADGIFQSLKNSDSSTIEIYVYDFGTSEKAESMFSLKKSSIDSAITFPVFSNDKVVGFNAVGAVAAYAVFDKFYFETILTGKGAKDYIPVLQPFFRQFEARSLYLRDCVK